MGYGNGDGRWVTTTTTEAETTTRGAATTMKTAGSPPPPPPPIAITSGPDPLSQYALCIAISARGHSRSASPRKKDHVPFLVVAAPPLVRLRLPPLIRLSFASMDGCRVTFCHIAFTLRRAPPFPVCRCPFRFAVAPSIVVVVALPSRHPLPPSLVDCCRFSIAIAASTSHYCHRGRSVTPAIAVHCRCAIHCRLC